MGSVSFNSSVERAIRRHRFYAKSPFPQGECNQHDCPHAAVRDVMGELELEKVLSHNIYVTDTGIISCDVTDCGCEGLTPFGYAMPGRRHTLADFIEAVRRHREAHKLP